MDDRPPLSPVAGPSFDWPPPPPNEQAQGATTAAEPAARPTRRGWSGTAVAVVAAGLAAAAFGYVSHAHPARPSLAPTTSVQSGDAGNGFVRPPFDRGPDDGFGPRRPGRGFRGPSFGDPDGGPPAPGGS